MHPRSLARPALAALVALALLAAACGGLGPDELPEEIGSDERGELRETIAAFIDGVNRYNPEVASEVMLIPAELGIPEVQRMVMQIAALEAEAVTVTLDALSRAELDVERGVVRANANTNIGPIEADFVRRKGEWRFASVPDLLPPAEFGGHHLVWEVTNSYESADGSLLTVVGRIDNVGDSTVLQFGTPGYFRDEAGATVVTTPSAILVRPFVQSGEHTFFRLDVPVPAGASLDLEHFVLLPTFRASFPVDEEVMASLVLSPRSASFAAAPATLEVLNGELSDAAVVLVTEVFDDAGRLLALYATAELPIAAGQRVEVPVPEVEPGPASEADRLTFEVWGTVPRN